MKIITKALAIRMSKVLGEIMDETQTAYIKFQNDQWRLLNDQNTSLVFECHLSE